MFEDDIHPTKMVILAFLSVAVFYWKIDALFYLCCCMALVTAVGIGISR